MIHLFAILGISLYLIVHVSHADQGHTVSSATFGYVSSSPQKLAGMAKREALQGPVVGHFHWPPASRKKRKVALLVPQTADTWLSFIYAAKMAADHLNVKMDVVSAGSYLNYGLQVRQLTEAAKHYDGIVLSAIDSHKMEKAIETASQSIPIVGYANEVFSPGIDSKAMVYYYDVTYSLALWIIRHSKAHIKGRPPKIAMVMGPKTAQWSQDMQDGFLAGIRDSRKLGYDVETVSILQGHTKPEMQKRLVELTLKEHQDIDYLFGIAPAITEAALIKAKYADAHPNLQLVASYMNSKTFRAVKKGDVLVAANDNMMEIGAIAMSQLLSLMRKEDQSDKETSHLLPFVTGPQVTFVTHKSSQSISEEDLFGPSDFNPVIINTLALTH